jgi:hypothetical protein
LSRDFIFGLVRDTDRIFDGLPKPKPRDGFFRHDIDLIFTPWDVQVFAIQQHLNKSQTKAVAALAH